MKVFISGGCKSGKSTHAEKIAVALAAGKKPLYYAATMIPADLEDEERILRHRDKRRGLGFETVETQRDVIHLKQRCGRNGIILIDSLTALLANEMFLPKGVINECAHVKICMELDELFARLSNFVIVSDYIYSDALAYGELTYKYREGLSAIDRFCAASCEAVIEAVSGNFVVYKGKEALDGIYKQIV